MCCHMETLERAATWSDEEKLIQLAGHHRGKGLQECNLVPEEEESMFQGAVEKIRDILGPVSHVLATQDYQHMCQEVNETVPAFVQRLDCALRVAMAVTSWDPRPGVYFYLGRCKMGCVRI